MVPRGNATGCGVLVFVLPVEVPVRNVQQRRRFPIRHRRAHEHFLGQIVRVRIDAQRRDIDRHLEPIGDLVVILAGGNVDRLRPETEHQWCPRRRFIGEIQADRRANRFGTTGWLQVHLDDEISAGFERPLIRLPPGRLAGRPAQKMSVGKARTRNVHPREAGRRFLCHRDAGLHRSRREECAHGAGRAHCPAGTRSRAHTGARSTEWAARSFERRRGRRPERRMGRAC